MTIDPRPENTPALVQEREDLKRKLLMLKDNVALPPDDDLSVEDIEDINTIPTRVGAGVTSIGNLDPLIAFAELLKNYGEHKEVKVFTPIGTIVLRALHVSVNQTSVAMILSKDDMHIEPVFGSELHIEIDGRPLHVIYGGGLFTFKKIPVTFLSFFRVSEEITNDSEVEDAL